MTDDQATGPAGVTGPNQPKQAGNIYDRWWWIAHWVWTERMLTRLEASEPTTVWFGLWDKVISERNLQAGFWAVWRNRGAAGVDGQTVPQFEAQEQAELAQLREELRSQHYRRQPARRVWIPKPGTTEKRPLGTNLRQWSEGAGLSVHPTKTRIVNVRSEGFDFLGWCGHRRLSALLKLTYG